MATLKEYFEKDGSKTLCIQRLLHAKSAKGDVELEIIGRLHLDFDTNAKYISYYIPSSDKACPARVLLNSIDQVLAFTETVYAEGGFSGEEPTRPSEMQFTGRVFIYSEDAISQEDVEYIKTLPDELGYHVQFRSNKYTEARNELEQPLAFVSHDSRDGEEIAKPLALELQKLACPVWYDEFSLRVGDSLRESIEKGLKECKKCIFILTPHFLANGGWAKREYDSVFTRELVKNQQVILPVWCGVTHRDVYEYSPILADRKGVQWETGLNAVSKELVRAIRA